MILKRPALPLAFLLIAACFSQAPALKVERLERFAPASGKKVSLEVASGRAIVGFKAGVSSPAAVSALSAAGFPVRNTFERFGWSVVALPRDMRVSVGLAILKAMPQVEYAEPDRVFRASLAPDDPYIARQYALAQVQAFGAWEYETGSSSRVTVAVLDTGIDASHPELSGKLVGTSRKFTPDNFATPSDDQPPTAACNHATRAAGVAAAASDNGAGVAGMSWGAKLLSLKVFADTDCEDDCSDEGGNSCGTTEASIAAAINDVIAKHGTATYGKIILNMSLGSAGSCSGALQTAVNSASGAGIMLFAAGGNAGSSVIDSPANCNNVYPVGATNLQDSLAVFSNSGSEMQTHGITAPGVDLYTTDISSGYASATGTSFSSPMAAGLAALLWSAKPSLSGSQVFDLMKNSADDLGTPGPDWYFGYGRINALKAMRLAMTGSREFKGTNTAVAYPNPFRPKTHRMVSFTVPEEMMASGLEVKVYTTEGELVRKLESPAWDGKNDAGAYVASGVYIFRVKTDSDAAVGKMALLR